MKTNLGNAGLNIAILLTVATFLFEGQASGAAPAAPKLTAQSISNALDNVICTSAPSVDVYSENLNKVVFQAKSFETAKIFQGWAETKKTITK